MNRIIQTTLKGLDMDTYVALGCICKLIRQNNATLNTALNGFKGSGISNPPSWNA